MLRLDSLELVPELPPVLPTATPYFWIVARATVSAPEPFRWESTALRI